MWMRWTLSSVERGLGGAMARQRGCSSVEEVVELEEREGKVGCCKIGRAYFDAVKQLWKSTRHFVDW
jgi:hypothetical protein